MEELDPNNEEHQTRAQIELMGALQLLTEIRLHFMSSDVLTRIEMSAYSLRAEETIRRKLKEKLGDVR